MEPEKKSNGAFVGLVIIIIILVVGGIYIWLSNQKAYILQNPQAQSGTVTDQDAAALDALESDLDGTNTNIDVGTDTIN